MPLADGTAHAYGYDVLGRLVCDEVTAVGSGVLATVRKLTTAYDGQGNAYLFSSHNAFGDVVNQVRRAFNGLGQLVVEYQQIGGAVILPPSSWASPRVEYTYSEMDGGANHSRLESITYPSGYVLTHNYASGLNDDISRLSSLSDSSVTLESYDYLGLGTVVRRSHPQPGVDLTYIGSPGDAGDQYAGLDRFGRIVDQRWTDGTADVDRYQYGYDRAGNRTYRENAVNTALSEVYSYDGLSQLTGYERGTLNGSKDGIAWAATR